MVTWDSVTLLLCRFLSLIPPQYVSWFSTNLLQPPSPSLGSLLDFQDPTCPRLLCCPASAEQHRELVRSILRTILNAGYSPLSFFSKVCQWHHITGCSGCRSTVALPALGGCPALFIA